MAVQRTLSIIKPDATLRNISGEINSYIENAGLQVVAQKRIFLSRREAKIFYQEHDGKPFFEELVEFMVSAPVVVQVLEGDDAINKYRQVMGATNPDEADEGTIRKSFAKNVGENSVHGSDSEESAKREISFFFAEREIVG